jgi:hypothetical protein
MQQSRSDLTYDAMQRVIHIQRNKPTLLRRYSPVLDRRCFVPVYPDLGRFRQFFPRTIDFRTGWSDVSWLFGRKIEVELAVFILLNAAGEVDVVVLDRRPSSFWSSD